MAWQERHTVLIKIPEKWTWKEAVIGFSLDGTLIETKTGNPIPSNERDWKWIFKNTVQKLSELNSHASLVILTHDHRIGKGQLSKQIFCKRLDNVLLELSQNHIEVLVICGTKPNCFSKPFTRLWSLLLSIYKRYNKHSVPDVKKSIYVGEMGGHLASKSDSIWGNLPKDSYYYDRAFSHNIGLRYWAPDVFFNRDKYNMQLNPKDFPLSPTKVNNAGADELKSNNNVKDPISALLGPTITNSTESSSPIAVAKKLIPLRQWSYKGALQTDELEDIKNTNSEDMMPTNVIIDTLRKFASKRIMVIIIGAPGSGKSTVANLIYEDIMARNAEKKDIFSSCFIVSTSTHKQTMRVLREHIKGGADIIIDMCNPSSVSRREYVSLTKGRSYGVLFVKMEITDRLAQHFNHMSVETTNDFSREVIRSNMYVAYNKKFQDPSEDEADEIAMVRYVPTIKDDYSYWLIY
jgi:DNA 3'-phosphatase